MSKKTKTIIPPPSLPKETPNPTPDPTSGTDKQISVTPTSTGGTPVTRGLFDVVVKKI